MQRRRAPTSRSSVTAPYARKQGYRGDGYRPDAYASTTAAAQMPRDSLLPTYLRRGLSGKPTASR
jgi:hypothetical protein